MKIRAENSNKAVKGLTLQQLSFAKGIVMGMTQLDAYKEAYPSDASRAANLSVSAYRLSRHPQIIEFIQASQKGVLKALAEDYMATKRFVKRELIALSKEAKQEPQRIKALELLGKACGLFNTVSVPEVPISPSDLKMLLSRRLDSLKQCI